MSERFSIDMLHGSQDPDDTSVVIDIVRAAVDSALQMHADTGVDLTCWPEMLQLASITYPYIIIEGTGPTTDNSVTSPDGWGETGRYWLDGDTSKPCPPCYGTEGSAFARHLPLPATR
jgi:hypothetical protein